MAGARQEATTKTTTAKGFYARVNDGTGKFSWQAVQIQRGAPVAIPGATSYLYRHPMIHGSRKKPESLGKDLRTAYIRWQNLSQDDDRARLGKLPIHTEPTKTEPGRKTIAEAVEKFRQKNDADVVLKDLRPRSRDLYNMQISEFQRQIGVTYLDEITREVLIAHRVWLVENLDRKSVGKQQNTVATRFRTIQKFLNMFNIRMTKRKHGYEGDPGLLEYREAPKPVPSDREPYSEEELNAMLVSANVSVDDRDYVQFLLKLGVRDGEIKHAEWSDISAMKTKQGTIHVFKVQAKDKWDFVPKSKQSRMIQIEDGLYKRLVARKKRNTPEGKTEPSCSLIFPNTIGTVDDNLMERLRRVAKAASLSSKGFDQHRFRHTFATLISVQAGSKTAQALLGHSDIKTTERYLHTDAEAQARAINGVFSGVGD